ncbi:MAG: hypothetical protein WBG86_03150 [Polyangiales bacterium]
MKDFHCVVGNKGGVGKSVAASWLLQYAMDQGIDPLGIECDPSNRTLSCYEELRVKRLELLDSEQQIDTRRFDALVETLLDERESFVVMDNGQASFAPLTRYMYECGAFRMLRNAGRACYVHTIVTGGQLGRSTLVGLKDTLEAAHNEAHVVVWRNEHFGPVDEAAYAAIVDASGVAVLGPVQLHRWSPPFEKDVQQMLSAFATFQGAMVSPDFRIMAKHRLTMVRDHVFGSLERALNPEVGKLAENA